MNTLVFGMPQRSNLRPLKAVVLEDSRNRIFIEDEENSSFVISRRHGL